MMTTKRISELPDASTLDFTEVVPLVQSGSTRKSQIANFRAGLAAQHHTHVLADIVDAGTAASHAATDFATAAQGAKADTAVQPASLGTAAYQSTTAFATAAQGTKADSAVQPSALGTVASHAVTEFATAAQGAKADTAVQLSAIGTAASHAATDFATAAQGAKADTAVQPASLGTAAYQPTTAFATAAQGTLANTAVQPASLGTAAYQPTTAFATAAQGTLANTAVQPGSLAAIATSGQFSALLNAPMHGFDNGIINGCCRMSQRASATITNAYQYGAVDLLAVKAAGTITAGTIQQDSGSALTATGFACTVSGATLDSSGVIYFRHRIEAKDSWRFKNNLAYFSCRVYHNAGSAINFTVTVRKANASDDFTATTDIQSGTVSIPSATNSDLTLAVSSMGDCGNGIEIEVKATCGAVTAKNFSVGDLQLVIANFKRPFLARPYALEQQMVYRFLQGCYAMQGVANSTSAVQLQVFHQGMRAVPVYLAVNKIDITDCYTADYSQSSVGITSTQENTKDHGRLTLSYFSGLTAGRYYMQKGTDRYILASAEL